MFSGSVHPGAGALVQQGDKVLMALVVRRNLLRWELPAGVANDGETMEATAIREVEEETFLRVTPGKLIGSGWHAPGCTRCTAFFCINTSTGPATTSCSLRATPTVTSSIIRMTLPCTTDGPRSER